MSSLDLLNENHIKQLHRDLLRYSSKDERLAKLIIALTALLEVSQFYQDDELVRKTRAALLRTLELV